MKKIILTLSGIFFVIFTGCSLLICMISGIPTFEQPAATFYLLKAIALSFGFPLIAFGFFAHNLYLHRKLEKKNQLIRNFRESILAYQKSSCGDSLEAAKEFKDSLTCLFCAFAEDGKLSEDEQRDLLDFIDKF